MAINYVKNGILIVAVVRRSCEGREEAREGEGRKRERKEWTRTARERGREREREREGEREEKENKIINKLFKTYNKHPED